MWTPERQRSRKRCYIQQAPSVPADGWMTAILTWTPMRSNVAPFSYRETDFILLDTPGHVDFSAEAERVFPVLDYAVLVISGTDGVQSHTETLWKLLDRYQVPVFLFISKMDIACKDPTALLEECKQVLHPGCSNMASGNQEDLAYLSEEAMRSTSVPVCTATAFRN